MSSATTDKPMQEESMEDILHSIRDIIAEEEGGEVDTLAKIMDEPSATEAVVAAKQQEDVLELTEVVVDKPKDVLDNIDAALNDEPVAPVIAAVPVAEPVVASEPKPQVSVAASPIQAANPVVDLISDNTAAATQDSLRNLLHSIPRPAIESPVFRGGLTVEDLVMEALKPMLSEWLDRNLASLVEDVVQREIRKLVPRE